MSFVERLVRECFAHWDAAELELLVTMVRKVIAEKEQQESD